MRGREDQDPRVAEDGNPGLDRITALRLDNSAEFWSKAKSRQVHSNTIESSFLLCRAGPGMG